MQNTDISTRRNPHRFNTPVSEFESMNDLLAAPSVQSGISVVRHGKHHVDLQYIEEESDTLLVSFNSAIPIDDRQVLPVFQFYYMTEGLRVSKLSISDPALDVSIDISSGWYTGASDLPLQTMLPQIINKFATRGNGELKKIVLLGSSAGGFAAMQVGSQLPGSLVVVNAPQTDLRAHTKESIDRFANWCFGAKSREEIENVLQQSICSSVIPSYSNQCSTKIIYLQNLSDPHIEMHLKPFLNGLGLPYTGESMVDENFALILGEWGDGHVFAPIPFIQWILHAACTYPSSNFDGFINSELLKEMIGRSG